jgi:hypothetical protein
MKFPRALTGPRKFQPIAGNCNLGRSTIHRFDFVGEFGEPETIRTSDLCLRRATEAIFCCLPEIARVYQVYGLMTISQKAGVMVITQSRSSLLTRAYLLLTRTLGVW